MAAPLVPISFGRARGTVGLYHVPVWNEAVVKAKAVRCNFPDSAPTSELLVVIEQQMSGRRGRVGSRGRLTGTACWEPRQRLAPIYLNK